MGQVEVDANAVIAAGHRLRGIATVTPLLRSGHLDERVGGTVLLKAENLQIGGAFKFRGAFNRLVQLNEAERLRGVVAWSSGNHAQGVAAAARRLAVKCTIVMPRDAPSIKIDNTRRLGAEIVFYDRLTESREQIATELATKRSATLVPSYDDPHVIAGQGTVGLEIANQVRSLNLPLHTAVVPCGGGGLIAGCALALKSVDSRTEIYSAEPAAFDDTARSLASGRRESVTGGARTLCDALMAPEPGELTFPINQRLVSGGLVVSDEMTIEAIRYAWAELKLVLEPGGAVALAAVLGGKINCSGKTVAVVLSGGNVDAAAYAQWLSPV